MTGIDLAHEIQRWYEGLPVVLTSGYSHVLAENGTDGFELLHKPYSVETLSRLLCGAEGAEGAEGLGRVFRIEDNGAG